jgi:hypothetical protein
LTSRTHSKLSKAMTLDQPLPLSLTRKDIVLRRLARCRDVGQRNAIMVTRHTVLRVGSGSARRAFFTRGEKRFCHWSFVLQCTFIPCASGSDLGRSTEVPINVKYLLLLCQGGIIPVECTALAAAFGEVRKPCETLLAPDASMCAGHSPFAISTFCMNCGCSS